MFPHLVLLLNMLGGWMNRHQQMAIDYLMEENKVLKELHGDKRLNFTNEQRKRLGGRFSNPDRVLWSVEDIKTHFAK